MTRHTKPPKSALLIIDVQQSFEHMPYWPSGQLAPFQQALLKLEAGCRAADVPVVHIFHIDNDPPFRADSGLIQHSSHEPHIISQSIPRRGLRPATIYSLPHRPPRQASDRCLTVAPFGDG